jgi:ABC-type branched-subunit amino acid transport system substrate-binding protein
VLKRGLVIATAALMLLAACSSSKKSSSTATTAGGTATTAGAATATTGAATASTIAGHTTTGVTATEVHFGGILYKAFYGDAAIGFQARLKAQNDKGGVYGRKLVLDTTIDDNQTADTDLTAAKTLVQQDNVFMVAPVMTAAFGGADYLNSAKVPFSGWSIEPRWCGLMWGFGFEGNDCDQATAPKTGDFVAAEQKLFPDGSAKGKAIVLTAEDNDSARAAVNDFAKIWSADGAKVVLVDTSIPSPPAVVGDFTPFVQKIMTSNNGGPPDLVEMVNSVSDTIGLYKKLEQLGYKGVAQGFTNYDPRLLTGATKGLVTETQFAPYEDASTLPRLQQMIADMKAYSPSTALGLAVAAGYWSADFIVQALQKAGPDLSRESFYNAINSGFTFDTQGVLLPVQWPQGHTWNHVGLAFVQDDGDHFGVPVHLQDVPVITNPGYGGTGHNGPP